MSKEPQGGCTLGPVGRGPVMTSRRMCFGSLVLKEEKLARLEDKMDISGQDSLRIMLGKGSRPPDLLSGGYSEHGYLSLDFGHMEKT